MQHSLVFENSFASGRKSIDAIPSLFCKYSKWSGALRSTPYVVDGIHSFTILFCRRKATVQAFFHRLRPMGRWGLSVNKAFGIKNYYGKNEYNNDRDYDGIWGFGMNLSFNIMRKH